MLIMVVICSVLKDVYLKNVEKCEIYQIDLFFLQLILKVGLLTVIICICKTSMLKHYRKNITGNYTQ